MLLSAGGLWSLDRSALSLTTWMSTIAALVSVSTNRFGFLNPAGVGIAGSLTVVAPASLTLRFGWGLCRVWRFCSGAFLCMSGLCGPGFLGAHIQRRTAGIPGPVGISLHAVQSPPGYRGPWSRQCMPLQASADSAPLSTGGWAGGWVLLWAQLRQLSRGVVFGARSWCGYLSRGLSRPPLRAGFASSSARRLHLSTSGWIGTPNSSGLPGVGYYRARGVACNPMRLGGTELEFGGLEPPVWNPD